MAEKRYRVINQAVEVNGMIHQVGDDLMASAFRPASGNQYADWSNVTRDPVNGMQIGEPVMCDEPSEIESLLSTGHIEEV